MMLSILSCVCRPSVYLLWSNVSRSSAHFWIGLFVFFDIELHELLVSEKASLTTTNGALVTPVKSSSFPYSQDISRPSMNYFQRQLF